MKRSILRWMTYSVICAAAASTLTGCIDSQSSATAPEQQVASAESPELIDAGEYYLWQGDMLLQKNDPVHAKIISELKGESSSGLAARSQNVSTGAVFTKWPNGNVPYFFAGTNWTAAEKNAFRQAMTSYSNVAQITFSERTQAGPYVVTLQKMPPAGGCGVAGSSTVGWISSPNIKIAPDQASNLMVLRHELGHTLGFAHEHSRPERDRFIRLNLANVIPGLRDQFSIFTGPIITRGPYDIKSIMHYKSYSTAPAGCSVYDPTKPMLTTINGGAILNTDLSTLDVQGVAKAYGSLGPITYLTDDATFLYTWYSPYGNPSDIAASPTHVYLKLPTVIYQKLNTTFTTTASVAASNIDFIDYVDATFGLVGASKAEKRVYINLFGAKQSIPFPAAIQNVVALNARTIGGQLNVIFSVSGLRGTEIAEYKVVNGQFVLVTTNTGLGYYSAPDITTNGTFVYSSSSYYFTSFFRGSNFAGPWAPATFVGEYNSHAYLVPSTLEYQTVSAPMMDWTTRNGASGTYALNKRGTNVDVIWLPLKF